MRISREDNVYFNKVDENGIEGTIIEEKSKCLQKFYTERSRSID